jgi:DNA-directed RNA polymerase subunit M/transcription elongation factor TFIIS
MGNPNCSNCNRMMLAKWRKTNVGEKGEGLAKFWVCNKCDIRFKIGAEVIRKKTKGLSEDEIRKNLNLPPKPYVSGHKHKHKKKKEEKPAMFFPSKPALLTTPFNTVQPKEDEKHAS